MAKSLKDILAGVKSSKIVPGSTGVDPGVDYMPKAPAEQDFVAKHKTEKHADRVGNGDDVYSGSKMKNANKDPKNKRLVPNTRDTYEEVEIEEEKICTECGNTTCGCEDKKKGLRKLLLGGKKESSVKEEVEDLDEIGNTAKGRKALGGYLGNAISDREMLGSKLDRNQGDKDDLRHHKNRGKGINRAIKKLTKEEFENLNEIGDTAKGRKALKSYIAKNVAGKEALDKEYAHSHKEREKHGSAFFKATRQHEKGARTKSEVEQLREPHEKAQKKEQHLFKKVRHRDEGQIKAQKRIESKGKDFHSDDPIKSKRKVEASGKGVREETISEVITSKTSISDIIHDFIHSDNPKFDGKSKEERKRMALGAYYAKHPEKSVKEDIHPVQPLIGEDGKTNKKKVKK